MERAASFPSAASVASFTNSELAAQIVTKEGKPKKTKLNWYRRFAYQRFVGWRPILNPHHAELFFLAVGVLCVGLGIHILTASLGVKEYRVRYDNQGPFGTLDAVQAQAALLRGGDRGVRYSVDIAIDEDMKAPVRCAPGQSAVGSAGGRSGWRAGARVAAAAAAALSARRGGQRGGAALLARRGEARRSVMHAPAPGSADAPCPASAPIPSQVWMAYELSSFFQNYRRYVRSLDTTAMHDGPTANPASACEPFAFTANATGPYEGGITPCGLIAYSFFNDTYQLTTRPPGGLETALPMDVRAPRCAVQGGGGGGGGACGLAVGRQTLGRTSAAVLLPLPQRTPPPAHAAPTHAAPTRTPHQPLPSAALHRHLPACTRPPTHQPRPTNPCRSPTLRGPVTWTTCMGTSRRSTTTTTRPRGEGAPRCARCRTRSTGS